MIRNQDKTRRDKNYYINDFENGLRPEIYEYETFPIIFPENTIF